MSSITIDANLCRKDGTCVAVCPTGALGFDKDGVPVAFSDMECIVCGQCMAVCPNGALSHPEMPDSAFEPMPESLPTPEEMDGLLKSRRSIRAFQDKPVAPEVVMGLLDVARRAPTANNSQKLRWVVLDGKEKVRELAKEVILGIDSVSMQPSLLDQLEQGQDKLLRGAPMVVAVIAPTEYAWGKEEAAIALAYFEMAAKARNIGVCWAGYLTRVATAHAPVRWMLKVPDGYSLRGALMVGYSKYAYHRVPPRKDLDVLWC